MIKDVVFNNTADGMASMETLTRDLTTHIKAHNATWMVTRTSSPMVTASVDAAGTLSVSIAKTSTYGGHTVTVEATDSRGAKESADVKVRRNRKPTVGVGLGDPTGVIWLGTQAGTNTKSVKYVIGSSGCKPADPTSPANTDCAFGDDDMVTFDVASGNMRQVMGAHKDADEITVTGLMSSHDGTNAFGDANFNTVYLAVRAKDSGELYSDYRERFVMVKVNAAPMAKENARLPARALDFGQEIAAAEGVSIAEAKAVFVDPDAAAELTDHTVALKSLHPTIATITGEGPWGINAIGPGEATIEVTLTEPTGASDTDRSAGISQTAKQTFTVTVRDS